MTDVYKNSLLFKLGRLIANQWQYSFIGSLFIKNTNDIKIKSSFVYRFINCIYTAATNALYKLSDGINRLISDSVLAKAFIRLLVFSESAFKSSLLCKLIITLTECNFECKGLKLYMALSYLLVFIAPIAPTMVCAGIALAALALFLIDCIRNKSFPKTLSGLSLLIFLLICVFGIFAIFSLTPEASVKIWMLYFVFMLSYFLIANTANTKDGLYNIAVTMVLSGFLVSLYGIYQRFFGDNIGHAWLDKEMFAGISLRVYSTLENPNVLGEYLLLAIPVCAAVLWTRRTWISRVFYCGIFFTMLLCMLFTHSRGCWLGLILAAAVFVLFADRRLVILGIAAVFAAPLIMPESIIERFTSIGDINDSSTSYRLFIWLGTINMLRDFGIYGIGLGSDAFNKIYPFYSYSSVSAPHAHNIYLQLLCETGIVGLVLFIIIVIIALKKMLTAYLAERKGFAAISAVAIMAGISGFMLQGAFDYVWYNYRVFLIFWMTMAIGISTAKIQMKGTD